MLNGYLDNNTYTTPTEPHISIAGDGRRILVVDDETGARNALVELLKDGGYEARGAADGFKAIGILQQWRCDLLLTDLRMPVMDGLTLLRKTKELRPDMVCIIMTAYGSVENAVEAMKLGADDYLTKPLNFDAVEVVLERAFERMDMKRELEELRRERSTPQPRTRIIGNSPAIQEVHTLIDQVATARATVLITGESGTGKELIARMIHEKSDRCDEPFVRLHCAALSESLLESELFGHEKGSFTGAISRRQGRFEEANQGTLFLDEIGEIPMSTQVKLLRFLQQREFERVGGNRTINVDVRIVAATNKVLEEAVRKGAFREDLYFRLNVIHVKSPPLRTRRSDIPVLVRHFIVKYSEENKKNIKDITPEALEILMEYDWPGNVRELENIIERAVVLAEADIIDVRHLPPDFGQTTLSIAHDIRIPGSSLAELERFAILKTYEATGGNTSETADMLGISIRKVQYKLKDYRSS
ncbi:MAG: sigma-54 dependent transcriptional regulator [Myxococcota bacterium]